MQKLYTPEGEALRGQPWPEYPRPFLERDSFYNLNGEWEFAAQGAAPGTGNMRPCGDKKIRGLRSGRDTLPRGGRNRDGDCGGVDEGEWGFARPLRIHGAGLARPRI